MACTGFDAVCIDLCQKAEHASDKYHKDFNEVLERMKIFHEDWETQ